MTSTSVKDVNAAAINLMPGLGGGKQVQNVEASFQSVWDNQAGKGQAAGAAEQGKTAKSEPVKQEEPTVQQRHEQARKPEPVKAEAAESQEPEEGKLEEAMEVLETAAVQLTEQIAETFGMDVEEVQAVMEGLGMQETDILDPQALGKLLLTLGGAEDSMALLTDETLYADYQALMGAQEDVLQEAADALGMDVQQLQGLLDNQDVQEGSILAGQEAAEPGEVGEAADVPEEPEIRITVENAGVQETEASDGQQAAPNVSQQGQRSGSREHHAGKEGQEQGFFAQNFERVETQLPESPVTAGASAQDVDTQNIMRQIMDYMKIRLGGEVSDMEMQLHPASLGTLQIHVAAKGGVLTANFVTENEAVKAALESQMVQLKESFAEQGMKVEAIEVTVQTHQFEQNLEQGRGHDQSGNAGAGRKGRIRRINLNAPLEEEGGMEEEDRITADMMAAAGSTVDYTA